MAYTFTEKLKIRAYAVGSAIATGTTIYGGAAAMSLSTPFVIAAVGLGATVDLLHTKHAISKQIKKIRTKRERDEEQRNDLQRLMDQLAALKPQMQSILNKEQERLAEIRQKKNASASVSMVLLPEGQAAIKVAEVRRDTAAKNRQKARTWRESKMAELNAALKKLDQDLIIQPQSTVTAQSKPVAENPEEAPTSRFEKIGQLGAGFATGFAKAGAVTFGAIKAGADLAGSSVGLFSAFMTTSVGIFGLAGALGNAYLVNKENEIELQDEEQYQKYLAQKRKLQADYDGFISLVKQLNQAEIKPRRNGTKPSTPLPGAAQISQPIPLAALPAEKSEDNAHEPSAASQKSVEISISISNEDPPPAAASPSVALNIRPATPSSGKSKDAAARPTTPASATTPKEGLPVAQQRQQRLAAPTRMFPGSDKSAGIPPSMAKDEQSPAAASSSVTLAIRPATPSSAKSKGSARPTTPARGAARKVPLPAPMRMFTPPATTNGAKPNLKPVTTSRRPVIPNA